MSAPAPASELAGLPPGLATIGPVEVITSHVQLFLFSAVTWNPHRIHYDRAHAADEGYPDVLVQSHLHAALIAKSLMASVGPRARLLRFGWQNRGIACPGQPLVITGRATASDAVGSDVRVDYELEERHAGGDLAVTAWAGLLVPATAFAPTVRAVPTAEPPRPIREDQP